MALVTFGVAFATPTFCVVYPYPFCAKKRRLNVSLAQNGGFI